jgi:hypothetical protein
LASSNFIVGLQLIFLPTFGGESTTHEQLLVEAMATAGEQP